MSATQYLNVWPILNVANILSRTVACLCIAQLALSAKRSVNKAVMNTKRAFRLDAARCVAVRNVASFWPHIARRTPHRNATGLMQLQSEPGRLRWSLYRDVWSMNGFYVKQEIRSVDNRVHKPMTALCA